MTNSQTYLIKNVVGLKAFYDLYSAKNLRSLRDTYDFFDEQEKFTLISTIVDEEDLENE